MTAATKKSAEIKIDLEEMAQAGLHFGHRTSRVHPKIKPYLFGERNGIHIFDLEKTAEKLKEALKFVQELALENKVLLVVGTKIQLKSVVKEMAEECGLPFATERWVGGTFTNFDQIKKRIDYFKDLEQKRASGELDKYTKKERAIFDEELKVLERKIGGIKSLDKLPDAILVTDVKKNILSVKEAKNKGIKVIGIIHTNVDPNLVDYPIPANDDAISSVKYILDRVKDAIFKIKK
jgi:small subunit ribosomal protein S2